MQTSKIKSEIFSLKTYCEKDGMLRFKLFFFFQVNFIRNFCELCGKCFLFRCEFTNILSLCMSMWVYVRIQIQIQVVS